MARTADDYSLTASPGRRLPVAVRGQGCTIETADGERYLDACGGAMVTSLGHCHPRLVETLRRQAGELTFTYRFSFSNEPMLELAELLREVAPMPGAWAFFNSSGSESVESAIHLAVLYWQHLGKPSKVGLVSRYPSFHGSTLGALGISGSLWRRAFELILEQAPVVPAPAADIRARRSPAEDLAFGLGALEDAIGSRGADTLAAVFLEPITGASGGAIVPPDGYLEGVRELCDRNELLLICDETITGFGRTGRFWASEHWGVAPDVVTFAKGVTSGVTPFSGMLVARDVADVFQGSADGFPWGHTFSGNPLGCAVAAEVVRTIREEGLVERSAVLGARLRRGLERIAAASPHVGAVRGRGLLQALELVRDRETLEPLEGGSYRLAALARERRLMIYACPAPLGRRVIEAVMLAPPLVISEDEVDVVLDRLADAVAALGESAAR